MKQTRKPLAILISLLLSGIFAPLLTGMVPRTPERVAYGETSLEDFRETPTPSPPDEEPEATETSALGTDSAPTEPPMPMETTAPETTPDITPDVMPSTPPGNETDGDASGAPHPSYNAALGDYAPASAEPGGTLTLILPVRYQHGDATLVSNLGGEGVALPYLPGRDALQYDQSLAGHVRRMELILSDRQPDDSPLAGPHSVSSPLVLSGVNSGYAVFERLQIREDAQPGLHSLSLSLVWKDIDCDEEHVQMLDASVLIIDLNAGAKEEAEASPTPKLGCACCVHCTLCYNEDGEPSVESCACIDEQGVYTGCSCEASCSAQGEAMPEGENQLEESAQDIGQPESSPPPASWADCGCGCNNQIAQTSVSMPGGPIVFTFEELKAEMQRDGVAVIYLGYCDESKPLEAGETVNNGNITFPANSTTASEISLPPSKTTLTIVGTDPRNGKRVTLTDNPTNRYACGIHTTTNGQSITLRDMDIVGYSEWGVLGSGDGHTNVHFRFDNVHFSGVQMSRSLGSGSSVTLSDCTVMIRDMNIVAQEVAESRAVILEGINDITRQSAMNAAAAYSMFWLKGSPNSITVRQGASATLRTTNYVVYNDNPANSASFLIERGATLDVTTTGSNGCLSWQTYGVDDLTIRSGASLRLSHQNSQYNSLMFNNLTVEPGATLEIDRQVSNVYGCIGTVGTGATMTVDNPKAFVLQNPGSSGRLFAATASPIYTLTAPVMNLDVSGETRVWNNRSLGSFTVKGSPSTVISTSVEEGYGASPSRVAQNSANFNLYNTSASRLIMGDYSLSVDPLQYGAAQVTGNAPDGSTQTISEYRFTGFPLGTPLQQESGVGGGSYRTGGAWGPLGRENVRVYVQSKLGSGLYALAANTYRDAEPSLSLDVPKSLVFETTNLASYDQMIHREDADWAIRVYDGLSAGARWTLTAGIEEPLHTPDYSDSLPGSLMLILGDIMYPFMPGMPQVIAESGGAFAPIVTVQWPEAEGFHVFLPANKGRPNTPYGTAITWTLSAAP